MTSNTPQGNSTPDTAEAKIRHLLEQYGLALATDGKQGISQDEATQQLKGLLVDARIDERMKVDMEMRTTLDAVLEANELPTAEGINGYKSACMDVRLNNKERIAALQQTRQEEDA